MPFYNEGIVPFAMLVGLHQGDQHPVQSSLADEKLQ